MATGNPATSGRSTSRVTVRIKDRKKDMVNRGGLKVYPAEVENALHERPDILECAVVGRPDPILTERVVAFVLPRNGTLRATALREFLRDPHGGLQGP